MSEYATWHIVLQVIAGLMYAKQSNIVHRDIKPQNLFLLNCPPGFNLPPGIPFLKIADFGLAASIDRSNDTQLTPDGKVLGTPLYMAPEQASDSQVDHRADIYAIGATAYHMLSGNPMYQGESLMNLLIKKQTLAPSQLDLKQHNVSAASAKLIADMMQIDPMARPSDYAVIANRIKTILATQIAPGENQDAINNATVETIELDALPASEAETLMSGDGLEPSTSTPSRRSKWLWLIPIAGLILVSLGLLFFRPTTLSVSVTPMEYTTQAVPLYQPPGVAGWTSAGGSFNPELDGEKADVLELSGTARRQLPTYTYFAFRCGVNLLESDDVIFRFFDERENLALEAAVTAKLIVVTAGSVEQQSYAVKKDPWRDVTPDEPRYLEVMVATEPSRWEVWFDGESIAEIPPPDVGTIKTLEIESDEAVHLESVLFSERRIKQTR